MQMLINNRKVYSWIAFILVLIGDALTLAGIRSDWSIWGPWLLVTLGLVALLWIIGMYNQIKFGLRSFILSKLLSNAIGPSTLSNLYLLFFVIHIGWLGNALMSLFQKSQDFEEAFYPFLLCILVLIVLILFFPGGRENSDDNPTKVFVSGISLISLNKEGKHADNLTPMVKILKEANDKEKFLFLILQSNGYNEDAKNIESTKKAILLYYADEANKYYKTEDVERKQTEFEKLSIEEQLKRLINIVAKNRFPDKSWLREEDYSFEVRFTDQAVDYNSFEDCFSTIDTAMKDYEKPQYQLYFNVSPGTGIVGSLMTLMSIKGNRKLFYYPQFVGDTQIKEAVKSKIPLENLLSQALETLYYNQ